MAETPPQDSQFLDGTPGQTPVLDGQLETSPEAAYVAETLQKTEVVDTGEIPHPVYTIADRHVAFRNRNELAEFDRPWAVVSPEDGQPANVGGEQQVAVAAWQSYVEKAADVESAELLVVTATPEGIMAAAEELGSSNAAALHMSRVAIERGEYDETAMHVVDGILAALVIDDTGNMRETYDTDGYGVVLAGLLGDEVAASIINSKVAALHAYKFAEANNSAAELRGHIEKNSVLYPESIKPGNVALVHSTEHDLAYDADGTLILKAASQHRDDKLPRATVHFTVNGQVTSHLGGQWSDKNKLIITNFQDMLDADGLPECMNSVDTYYALNPGQALRLPGAKVIESSADQVELIEVDGSRIIYRDSQSYDAQEMATIDRLAEQYRIRSKEYKDDYTTLLREIALRQTLESVGVQTFVIAQAHYTDNDQFGRAYAKLASELGVGHTALHASTGDSGIEDRSTAAMRSGDYSGWEVGGGAYLVTHDASLQALRQVVASGYIPARPSARKPSEADAALLGF